MTRRNFLWTAGIAAISTASFAGDSSETLSLHITNDKKESSLFSVDRMLSKVRKEEAAMATVKSGGVDEQFLWLIRRDTGEEIKDVFAANGEYVYDTYKRFCWLMRDLHVKNGGFVGVDGNLMNILHRIQNTLTSFGLHKPIMIHSGYRSPITNARTEGAAKNSYHVKGKAVDISIERMDPQLTGTLGMMVAKGGVGFYPSKNFIHLDTGDIRYWVIDDTGRVNSAKSTVQAFQQ